MSKPKSSPNRSGRMGMGGGPGFIGDKPENFKRSTKKLLVSLKKFLPQIIIGLLFAGASTFLAIIGPDFIQKIGSLIVAQPIVLSSISTIGIRLIIIYSCSFLFMFLQNFIMSGVTAKVSKNFRFQLSEKINKLPLKYLDNKVHGDVLSRVTNDVDTLSETLNSSLSSIITCIATVVGSVIMMFSYSWQLTLIALIILPISMVVISIMFKFSQKYFKMQQESLGDINGHIEEIYSGHNIIKVFNGVEEASRKFDVMNKSLFTSSVKGNVISGLMHPLMNFFGNLGYAIIIIVGGIMSINNLAFIPYVMAFVIYYRMFNYQISQVATISSTIQTSIAASERIFEFLEENEQTDESNKKSKITETKGNIEFENVNFGYSLEKQVIHNLNVKIKKGQKVAVVGSTGAGKTTLVNLLMRFYELDSGKITIDGVDISDIKRSGVRKLFGMVLQDTWLFEGTINDNLAFGKTNITNEQIVEACKNAGVHHLIMSQPNGYDMIITEECNFSAGEKQLLTIARAMLHDAPILILDEATSSVDTRTEVLIQKAMNKLLKNRTAIIIAHRLSTIVGADVILVMKDGEIVESGNHKQLLEENGVYASLYKAQFS